jgi:hypothetical protein
MSIRWNLFTKYIAILISFIAYLPLIKFGELRLSLIIEVPAGYEALLLWLAIAISPGCQAILFFILLRIFRWKSVLRIIATIVIVLFLWPIAVVMLFSLSIPAICRIAEPTLIKHRRPLPENANGRVLCEMSNFEIYYFVNTPPNGVLGKNNQVWVRQRNNGKIGLMNAAKCSVQTTSFSTNDFLVSRFYATINGQAIFVKSKDRGDPEAWWYLKSVNAQPLRIERPDMTDDAWPILSDDGKWVGWVSPTISGVHSVILQNIETSETKRIHSEEFRSDRLRLLGFDTERAELLIARHNWEQALAVSSLDGAKRWGPIDFGKCKDSVVGSTLNRGNGWVIWYGRPLKDIVQWSLSGVEKSSKSVTGTEINSVDVSANGKWIAIGTWGDYEGSSIESAVYVIDPTTGKEVFREYFPRRSWVSVAFLGNDRLAYSAHSSALLIPGHGIKVVQLSQ